MNERPNRTAEIHPGKAVVLRKSISLPGEVIRRADLFPLHAPKDTYDELQYAIATAQHAHSLRNKFGTSRIDWNKVAWNEDPEEGEEKIRIGYTVLDTPIGKEACYIFAVDPDPKKDKLFYNEREWDAFVAGVKDNEFDLDLFGNLPLLYKMLVDHQRKKIINNERKLPISASPERLAIENKQPQSSPQKPLKESLDGVRESIDEETLNKLHWTISSVATHSDTRVGVARILRPDGDYVLIANLQEDDRVKGLVNAYSREEWIAFRDGGKRDDFDDIGE